jgi:signal peptidase I
VAEPVKPRFNVGNALILVVSACVPGLPQALLGHRRPQWIVFGAIAASVAVIAFTAWGFVLALAVLAGSAVDAVVRYAKRRGEIRWSWTDAGIAFGAALALVIGTRVFAVEAFKIPASSMSPTLLIGDHVFISRLASVGRGDVAVFVKPCEPQRDFVKRIVAVENDTIEVRCGVVYVNGAAVPSTLVAANESYIEDIEGQKSTREVSRYREEIAGHTFEVFEPIDRPNTRPRGLPSDSDRNLDFPRDERPPICSARESFPDAADQLKGAKIVTTGEPDGCKPFRHYVVPAGYVFALGDHRSNSADSRFWGPVPVANIKGRVGVIWLPAGRIGRVE